MLQLAVDVAAPKSRPLQALVVEDDPDLQDMLSKYLRHHGVSVLQASDGLAGWNRALECHPDVILTDLMMPQLSGPELIDRVRGDPSLAQTPVIVTSAAFFNEHDAASFRRRHQANAVFQKPLPMRKVVEATLELGEEFRRTMMSQAAVKLSGVAPVRGFTPVSPAPMERIPAPQGFSAAGTLRATAGQGGILELCRVFTELFDKFVSGILEVQSSAGLRRVHFKDGMVVATSTAVEDERLNHLLMEAGLVTEEQTKLANELMEKEGLRFGYAAVKVTQMPASAVAQALEEQTLWVTMQALASGGAWTFKHAAENVALGAQLHMDPVDAIQRVCLDCVPQHAALALMSGLGKVRLVPSVYMNDRLLLLKELRPLSPLHALAHTQELQFPEALTAGQEDNPFVVNHFLALYLSRAFMLEAESVLPQRAPVLATFGGVWRPNYLPSAQLALRESIALEWLRTGGLKAHEILGVEADAPPEHIRAALGAKLERVRPERLSQADLGPARRCLAVLRERWAEAARFMNAV